jgi:protein-tyrosine phosphatase
MLLPGSERTAASELMGNPSGQQAPGSRLVELDGVENFRDLGGYAATDLDGNLREVRWGHLYRSGHLHDATDADRERLADLGLAQIFDFRTDRERLKRPNSLGGDHGAVTEELSIDPGSGSSFANAFAKPSAATGITAEVMVVAMQALNRKLIGEHAGAYRRFFGGVLATGATGATGATLFQCTSGKDRTGMAALLLLSALGVSREIAIADYLLTNQYLTQSHQFSRALKDIGGFDSDALTPELLKIVFEVHESFALAAFDEIDTQFSGFDGYLETELGISEAQRGQLQERFLTPLN